MGLEQNSVGDFPEVAETAFVHGTATLIGHVVVQERVFIGPNAVLRADEPSPDGTVKPVVICEDANVQDCVVVHALAGTRVSIGRDSSVAHSVVIHGPCQIGSNCFVGFNSVVFKATLGDGVVVMHQSLVESVTVPPGLYVPSMTPVRGEADIGCLTPASPDMIAFAREVSRTNVLLARTSLER
ncbi:MAG: carbonate dehydratase [Planctomycetes bacterium]|nr:carbonate dehydratase [Planctomycetota bacterium]MBL7039126.1 carbonate dehydratase [Pirellulaceae bacterium]